MKSGPSKDSVVVTRIDPGITDGGMVSVEWPSKRLVACKPFSLQDYLPDPNRKQIISGNEVPELVMKMIQDNRDYFKKDTKVIIEMQMQGKLNIIQCAYQCYLYNRCMVSSPTRVRNYFGLRVEAKTYFPKKKKSTEGKLTLTKLEKKVLYNIRKNLSTDKVEQFIHPDDLKMITDTASKYWFERAQWYTRNVKNKSGKLSETNIENKTEKAVSDMVDAYIQAICPFNHGVPIPKRKRKRKRKEPTTKPKQTKSITKQPKKKRRIKPKQLKKKKRKRKNLYKK
jgi:hypothetical protein